MVRVLPALALLAACSPAVDPCAPMCDAVVDAQGACLADWGVGWDAVGYTDAEERRNACDTWAWELRHLERDADERGATDLVCEERTEALEADGCAAYTAIDWNALPWDDPE